MKPWDNNSSRNSLKLLSSAASQVLTKRSTTNLTSILHHIPSPYRLFCYFVASFFDRGNQFGLKSGGMDTIGMETFVDELGADHEVGEGVVRCEDMG
jgi:hypothetical protein